MNQFKILFGLSVIVFSSGLLAEEINEKASMRLSNDDIESTSGKSSSRRSSIKLSNQNERIIPSSNNAEKNWRTPEETKNLSSAANSNAGKTVSSKPEDIQYAKEAYARAQKGDLEAQCKLAYSYRHGKGIAQNDSEALRWYLKSANNGYGPSMAELISIYANSLLGVPKDLEKAYMWEYAHRLTPSYGGQSVIIVGNGYQKHVGPSDGLNSVESLLTPAQISRGQERAKKIVEQFPQNREKALKEKQQDREQAEVERAVKQQEREHQESLNELRRNADTSAESLRNVMPKDPEQTSRAK